MNWFVLLHSYDTTFLFEILDVYINITEFIQMDNKYENLKILCYLCCIHIYFWLFTQLLSRIWFILTEIYYHWMISCNTRFLTKNSLYLWLYRFWFMRLHIWFWKYKTFKGLPFLCFISWFEWLIVDIFISISWKIY